jgi:hypothetical protein
MSMARSCASFSATKGDGMGLRNRCRNEHSRGLSASAWLRRRDPRCFFFAGLAGAIKVMMVLLRLPALQVSRSARAGFIPFGGDDRQQPRNVHRDMHDSVMAAIIACRYGWMAWHRINMRW